MDNDAKELLTACAGSGVMETSQTRGSIDDIAAGEDVDLTSLAIPIITTTTMTVVFTGRHCFQSWPRLRWFRVVDDMY